MIIKKISLENFQCYCGSLSENEFDFSEGVNIITGNNGAGKSKLFNAFYWVLFGQIFTSHEWLPGKQLGHSFVSNRAKAKAGDEERVNCSVQLILEAPTFDLDPTLSLFILF